VSNPTPRPLDPKLLTEKVMARFWIKTEAAPGGCIVWTAAKDQRGYGHFALAGKVWVSHRIAFIAARGIDIPAGMQLDHLCRVRACCNVDHLEIVTLEENTLRGDSLSSPTRRSLLMDATCQRGHDMSLPDAWRVYGKKRFCRLCAMEKTRVANRRRDAEKRAERQALKAA